MHGDWAKKIKGKLHYFGTRSAPDGAKAKFDSEVHYLQSGEQPPEPETTLRSLRAVFLREKKALREQKMKYHFTIEKPEQGYRVTRDDLLGYTVAVASDDLGTEISKMIELAPPTNCLLQKLAFGIAAGLLREAGCL